MSSLLYVSCVYYGRIHLHLIHPRLYLYQLHRDCGITVKVNKDTGYVAIVHDAMSTYKENIPWLVDEEHTQNWFHVTWDGNYPGSDATNTCAANSCKTTTEGHCLCKTIVTESTVFSHTSVSKEDVIGQLFIGAIGVPSGASSTTLDNGLKVHIMNGNVDDSTIFEIEEKGKTTYLKNVRSTVSLEGWTLLPKIYEAEDAEVNNAVSICVIGVLSNFRYKPYPFYFYIPTRM